MSSSRSDLDTLDFYSSETYEQNGYPHAGWERLRREAPVYWTERLEEIELAAPVRRLRSSFVGGVKSMPIRYELRA